MSAAKRRQVAELIRVAADNHLWDGKNQLWDSKRAWPKLRAAFTCNAIYAADTHWNPPAQGGRASEARRTAEAAMWAAGLTPGLSAEFREFKQGKQRQAVRYCWLHFLADRIEAGDL